ncbi:MAG TPA: VOC family protein [Thermomicrobiales bacterium]|nr:VOC family protein [Thermomicrobiales bacterium]
MNAPRLQLTSVTIGCPNPRTLVAFYARLLGAEITADDPPRPGETADAGWAQLRTTGDRGTFTLNFEFERQWRAPVWPSEPDKQHITQHLDILVDDLEAAVAWAEACGATRMAFQPQDDVRVMRDPAGHPFCLYT